MFGFISDVVESVGDVILGERGSGQRTGRVAQIGATLAGAPPEVAAFAGKATTAYASGGSGQAATSSPTANQQPQYAPETAESSVFVPGYGGGGFNVGSGGLTYRSAYQPIDPSGPVTQQDYLNMQRGREIITAGLPASLPTAGKVLRDIATTVGGAIIENATDIIPDIEIQVPRGNGMNVCATSPRPLISVRRRPDGSQCLSVTRKQQHQLKQMVMYMGIEGTAQYVGLPVPQLAGLLVKKFPPRRKGISAAQLRTAKRVNRQVMGMAKQLQDACKTTTRRR